MVPPWVSKLKDLKAVSKSKPKQSKAPFLPGLRASLSESPDADGCIYFAEPLSLKGANGRSYSAHLELGRNCSTDADGIFLSSYNDAAPRMQPCMFSSSGGEAATSNPCRHGRMDSFNSTEVDSQSIGCGDFEHNFFALSSCGIMTAPHLFEGKGRMVSCVQDNMHGLFDNDTEGSTVLTPNTTDSSFGSESSSMDSSSVGHRRECADVGRQGLVLVQDGDDLSGLGSLESGIETCVYPEEAPSFSTWQRNSLLKEFQVDGLSYDKKVMSKLSYDEGALSRRKIRSENVDSVGSTEMGTIPRQTSNEAKGRMHWQASYSQNATELHSLSSVHKCRTQVLFTVGVAPSSALMMCREGSPSAALGSSFGSSLLRHMEERHICATGSDLSSVNGHNLRPKSISSFEFSHTDTCVTSTAEDLIAISDFWKEKNFLESPEFSGMPHSTWEERSALIAVENPGLMLSSRWQESACALQNSCLESSANIDQDCDPSTCDENGMPVCAQQDDTDGLSVSARQEHGNAGHHKSMFKAYVERGRRHRCSSFSAALPKDLQGVVGDSVALVKMSNNPYEDFRHSMYEMIMDKDLEESMDVEELLYCYLSLNSPEHHELIKEVFSDVWSAILISVR